MRAIGFGCGGWLRGTQVPILIFLSPLEVITTCFHKPWTSFPLPFLVLLFLCLHSCFSCWSLSSAKLATGPQGSTGGCPGLGGFFACSFCLVVTPLLVVQSYVKHVLWYFILFFKALNSFQTPLLSCADSERVLESAFKKRAIVRSVLCVAFCCLLLPFLWIPSRWMCHAALQVLAWARGKISFWTRLLETLGNRSWVP